jgi:TetR/AcrR family transcriptional regulator, fatty acid metabolism regulator protein
MNERSFRRPDLTSHRTSEAAVAKRGRILDAAIQVFAARGFYNARVSDIAREAGVADGTIYLYFKSKDDLLICLFEDRMERIIAAFREQLTGAETAYEQLRRFIELHLKMVAEQPSLAEVLTVELRQSAKFMREYKAHKFGEYLGLLQSMVEKGQAEGHIRPDLDPAFVRRFLFGALDEISLHWVSSRRKPYTLERAAEQILSICAMGVFNAPEQGDNG